MTEQTRALPEPRELPPPEGDDRGAARFVELVRVMARLRGEGGCPWDRQQTPASLKPYILEEAYELLEAIDGLGSAASGGQSTGTAPGGGSARSHEKQGGDRDQATTRVPARSRGPQAAGRPGREQRAPDQRESPGMAGPDAGAPSPAAITHFREELGDLLLQVVFQAEIAAERGWFTIGEVAAAIADKLIRRHPHVFGDRSVSGAREALANWEAIKLAERQAASARGTASALAGVPRELPALLRAQRLTEKAARVGFDWPDLTSVLAKVDEERGELAEAIAAGDRGRIADEFGDLLFALVNLGRFLGCSAEETLRAAIGRFVTRFEAMERSLAAEGRPITSADPAELDRLWEAAKAAERTEEGCEGARREPQ